MAEETTHRRHTLPTGGGAGPRKPIQPSRGVQGPAQRNTSPPPPPSRAAGEEASPPFIPPSTSHSAAGSTLPWLPWPPHFRCRRRQSCAIPQSIGQPQLPTDLLNRLATTPTFTRCCPGENRGRVPRRKESTVERLPCPLARNMKCDRPAATAAQTKWRREIGFAHAPWTGPAPPPSLSWPPLPVRFPWDTPLPILVRNCSS